MDTKLEIKSWDEQPYRELDDGGKFARADVLLAGTGDGLASGTMETLLYYRADGTSSFVSLMSLEGTDGSVVMQGQGTYDGTTAHVEYEVVPGTGTGALAGVTGATSISTHQDYPYMPLSLRS